MNITVVKFDETNIEKHAIGAGIIPISVDSNGKCHFLLAKERYNPAWKGSNRWSGFEGGRKSSEQFLETALREFNEESLGSIVKKETLKDIIEKNQYVIKLVVNIQQASQISKYHITYLFQVPWNNNYIENFNYKRNKLLDIQCCGKSLNYLEEISKVHQIHSNSEIGFIEGIKCIERVKNYMIVSYLVKDEHNPYKQIEKKVTLKVDKQTLMWQYMRECVTFILKQFDHESITKKVDKCNIVYKVSVHDDYLEKERMKWWSLENLKCVLKTGGNYDNEIFKSYFMPVLQCITDNI